MPQFILILAGITIGALIIEALYREQGIQQSEWVFQSARDESIQNLYNLYCRYGERMDENTKQAFRKAGFTI